MPGGSVRRDARFGLFVGIDYSGAETPVRRLAGLQVYAARPGAEPEPVTPIEGGRHWTRRGVAHWLRDRMLSSQRLLVGIDHGFSFPASYFERYGLADWPGFLEDFCTYWPTADERVRVDDVRSGAVWTDRPRPVGERTGHSTDLRLCERWTSSAKSVFLFDVQGSVAKSTHAGLPWLRFLRADCGARLHAWPFDGWRPAPDASVIAEMFPSVFRHRYPRGDRSVDAHDAYSVARWLADTDARGALARYFEPPLNDAERAIARREGWILGIT